VPILFKSLFTNILTSNLSPTVVVLVLQPRSKKLHTLEGPKAPLRSLREFPSGLLRAPGAQRVQALNPT